MTKKPSFKPRRQLSDYFHKEIRIMQLRSQDIIHGYLEKVYDERMVKGGVDALYQPVPDWWTRKMTVWFYEIRRMRIIALAEELKRRPEPDPLPVPYIVAAMEEDPLKKSFFTKNLGTISYTLPVTGFDPLPIHKNGVCLAMFHKQ